MRTSPDSSAVPDERMTAIVERMFDRYTCLPYLGTQEHWSMVSTIGQVLEAEWQANPVPCGATQ